MRPHPGVVVQWCLDAVVRWWPTVCAALASYWAAGVAWAVMTALHGRWLMRSAHAGEVLTAYGAGVVVLGLWVAVRELVRIGIAETARRQVVPESVWWAEQLAAAEEIDRAAAVEVRRAIIVERVVAGIIVAAGTLAGGWASPLARRWDLPV